MKLYDFDYDEQIERMENKICLFSVRFFLISYIIRIFAFLKPILLGL